MKRVLLLILLIADFIYGQDSTSVQVIARSLPNKVMLRWAVDQPIGWKKANEYGFLVERATISRNNKAVVPIERQMLTSFPLKPKPIENWATLANQDQNVAVLAQALFGSSFETTAPSSGILGKITAVNDETEQRFTFALLAAEQNYEGALLAGWALEDTSVVAGERYLYKVKVALPQDININIKDGTTYATPDLYEPLPKPIGLAGVFEDSKALLSWNFNLLSSIYTSYKIERSEDGDNFIPLNGTPIFNASQQKKSQDVALYYNDSIPNDKSFYYRVKGKNAFGEVGPPSEVVTGKAIRSLAFVPRIYRKEIPTDNKVILYWDFKNEGNEIITKFKLKRSNTNEGPFTTVVDDIPVTDRQLAYEGLKRINYFTITAVGKNGVESSSFPSIVQPVDSIPPAAPNQLKGVMDTTGIVKISWAKNIEEDLKGYRIFKGNNPNVEFSEVTNQTYEGENYSDTVQVANLNKKIYYKIQAEDQRFNRSKFSEVLEVNKPDVIPPSPPVLNNYSISDEGIRLYWTPSTSLDVAAHIIFRKISSDEENSWEKIFKTSTVKDSSFLDSKDLISNEYSYTIIAKDYTELESSPSNPLSISWKGKSLDIDDIKFNGTVNRELRFVNLMWKTKELKFNVSGYKLYRGGSANGLKLYKTFNRETTSFNDVDLQINSTYIYGLQFLLKDGRTSPIKKINLKY